MKKIVFVPIFLIVLIISVCNAENEQKLTRGSFQLIVRSEKVSLIAYDAKLKEILLQISKKTSSFTVEEIDNRRVTKSFENLSVKEAIQKLISGDYGFSTNKQGKIIFLFIAPSRKSDINFIGRDDQKVSHADVLFVNSSDKSRETNLREKLENPSNGELTKDINNLDSRKDIVLSIPVSISDADQLLSDTKEKGENVKQFIISFCDYQMLYSLQSGKTIANTIESEKSALINMLEQNRVITLKYPEPDREKSLKMIDCGLNALRNGEITLNSLVSYSD